MKRLALVLIPVALWACSDSRPVTPTGLYVEPPPFTPRPPDLPTLTYTLFGEVREQTPAGSRAAAGVSIEAVTCPPQNVLSNCAQPQYPATKTDANGRYSIPIFNGRKNAIWIWKEGFRTLASAPDCPDYCYRAEITIEGDTRLDAELVVE